MPDEIFDMEPPEHRARAQWSFHEFTIGRAYKTTDRMRFKLAQTAAHSIGTRNRWKFSTSWNNETQQGLIVRTA